MFVTWLLELVDVRHSEPSQSARVLRLMVIGLIAVVAMMVGVWLANLYITEWRALLQAPSATDFYKFYLSGKRLQQGLSMYWEPLPRQSLGDPCFVDSQGHANDPVAFTDACLHPNLNPPFFAVLAWPLAHLDYAAAWAVWSVTSVACGLLGAVCLALTDVQQKAGRAWRIPLVCLALFAYFPTYASLTYGQTTLFVLLLLVLGWRSLRQGCDVQAGVWFGLAASLKPFVALALLAMLFGGYLRAFRAAFVTCILAAVMGLILVGWDDHRDYMKIAGDVTWLAASWNASFAGYFSRIFGGSENVPWLQASMLAKLLAALFSAAVLMVVGILLHRTREWSRGARVDILFALIVPAMLLISPLGWLYYFPLLCAGFAVVWRLSGALKSVHCARVALLMLLVLTSIPRVLEPARVMNDAYFWFWGGAIYSYALITYFLVVLAVAWRLSAPFSEIHRPASTFGCKKIKPFARKV